MLYENKKLFINLFCATILCTMLSFGIKNVSAGNTSDTLWQYIYTPGVSGYELTDFREKQDDTSCYGRMESISNTTVTVKVYGAKSTSGSITNRTAGVPKTLAPGQAKYFPNYVKEFGEYYCRLNFKWTYKERTSIRIWWSPDSI